jgi:hypothetical protein
VVVGVSQLVHDCIQEALSGAVIELMHDLLECVSVFHSSLILASLLSDVEDYGSNDVLVDPSLTVDNHLTLLHLVAYFVDVLKVSCSLEIVEIFFEVHKCQEVLEVG